MGDIVALRAVLWLTLQAADLEQGAPAEARPSTRLELGIRAEGRATTLVPVGGPTETFDSGSMTPSAALAVNLGTLRTDVSYSLRLWSSDVVEIASPRTLQTASARLAVRPPRPWSLELTADGLAGTADPLANPFHTIQAAQPDFVAPSASVPYESLRTGARGERQVDLRTTLGAGAAWSVARGLTPEARLLLPRQQIASADASVAHRLTELDTLRVTGTAARTWTDAPGGRTSYVSASASAAWRRGFAPRTEGWADLGVGTSEAAHVGGATSREIFPVAEVGVVHGGPPLALREEVAIGSSAYVDPSTGALVPATEGRCAVRWRAAEHVSLDGSAAVRRSTDGASVLAFAQLWARWWLRPRVSLEAGLLGRSQRDGQQAVPSFSEGAVVGAVSYGGGPGAPPDGALR